MVSDSRVDITYVVGRLECGQEHGSAFFLQPSLVATCRHCILPHLTNSTAIQIIAGSESIRAQLVEPNIPEDHDVVFLRLERPVEPNRVLPLVASHLPRDLPWETFGFPRIRGEQGMPLEGRVARAIYSGDVPRDLELTCEGDNLPSDYGGFSGAPVIVDGSVRAMLQRRLDGGLGAISLARLHSYLDAAGVEFCSAKDQDQLPLALVRELKSTIPNRRTLWQIEEALSEQPDGYVFLTGHPGSGKTLVTATFQPTNSQLHVVGRYFASGHVGADLPPAYYGQPGTFAQWLSSVASLMSKHAVAVPSDSSTLLFSKSIVENLTAIAETFSGSEQGVLFIDGVEARTTDTLASFLDCLPAVPPDGLAIVITTTDVAALVGKHEHLRNAVTLMTHPLPLDDCEWLVMKSLGEAVSTSQAARVAELSQGHPLTLSYLVKEILAAIEVGVEDPISDLESSATGPEDYCLRVWNRISGDGASQYLLATMARLRGAVSEEELLEIIPDDQSSDFINSIARVRHVLRKDRGLLRFYHESFREFVSSQSAIWDDQIHARIADYCELAADSEYAVSNLLYHRLRTSRNSEIASQLCTQEWLDCAAAACVHPELVLSDLDDVLSNRLEAGDLKETIRLLLLSSRAHFRYNDVFARSATELTKATIALRSPAQSLRYIVRDGYFICPADNVLSVLRNLTIEGHYKDAERLYRDFREKLWLAYEHGVAGYSELRCHMAAGFLIAMHRSPHDFLPLINELKILGRLFQENLTKSGIDEIEHEQQNAFIYGAVWGQFLWMSGFVPFREIVPIDLVVALEETEIITRENGYVETFVNRPKMPESMRLLDREEIGRTLKELTKDTDVPSGMEALFVKWLVRTTNAYELVAELYARMFPVSADVDIRNENGVDADLLNVDKVRLANEAQGFSFDHIIADRISFTSRHHWEERLLNAAARLGYESGSEFRRRSLNEELGISFIEQLKAEFFPLIRFSLEERSGWKESYHIPEHVVPQLTSDAAGLIAELEPESSVEFADIILDHGHAQFGLYTEGYQRLLGAVADALATVPQGLQPAVDVRRALLSHISTCVFARKERVAGLLDSAQHLARIGATELAEQAFQETIHSSLGPNWYKEDQFRLMLEAIEAVDDPELLLSQWKKIVEILAYASGEATFQRFARYQKEVLIGHLSRSGFAAEALALYLHYVLPGYELQKARIERVNVDKTSTLEGNQFGVQEVDEQGAVLQLLSGLREASPLRRWAVIELYWPWGDSRHSRGYVREVCELLASDRSQVVGERLLRLLRAEVSPERRSQFVHEIVTHDANGITRKWLERAKSLGIIDRTLDISGASNVPTSAVEPPKHVKQESAEADEDSLVMPGVFGRRKDLKTLEDANTQAQARIERGDMEAARAVLSSGLRQAQKGDWDLWHGLEQADIALSQLLLETGSIEKGIQALVEIIMQEEHANQWLIASKLMVTVMPQLASDARHDLFSIVAEHIECLVKPERQHTSVEAEIAALPTSSDQISASDCIDRLLLSLLEHPNGHMRKRAADVLEWLARVSEVDLEILIGRIASGATGEGREIAIGILHRIVLDAPKRTEEIVSSSNFKVLKNDPSFFVRYLVEGVLGESWQPRKTVTSSGNKDLSVDWSFDASTLLELKESAHAMAVAWAHELCSPLSPTETRQLTDVRRQAFNGPPSFKGYAFEREAVFRALTDISDEDARSKVITTSLWNPLWPESQLRLDWSPLIPGILTGIDSPELETSFIVGGKTILHCFELEPPEQDKHATMTEVSAVLVCKEYFEGKLNREKLWESLSVHNGNTTAPTETVLASIQEPAIARFSPDFRIGGDLTPAFLSQRMIQLVGHEGIERVCWRDGRRWDLWGPGPVLCHGTALLIDSALLRLIHDYDLIWVIFKNEDLTCIVDPTRKTIYRGHDEY